MPIYEYCCTACKKTFSVLQKMGSGVSDTRCPDCGSGKVKKTLSAFACGSTPSAAPMPSGGG